MIRAWVLRWLEVDRELKAAFMEGFNMAGQIDPLQCRKLQVDPVKVARASGHVRVWRNAAEAWANSDTEERFK